MSSSSFASTWLSYDERSLPIKMFNLWTCLTTIGLCESRWTISFRKNIHLIVHHNFDFQWKRQDGPETKKPPNHTDRVVLRYFVSCFVVRTGIEPVLPEWKSGVLTPRRTDRSVKRSAKICRPTRFANRCINIFETNLLNRLFSLGVSLFLASQKNFKSV